MDALGLPLQVLQVRSLVTTLKFANVLYNKPMHKSCTLCESHAIQGEEGVVVGVVVKKDSDRDSDSDDEGEVEVFLLE